VGSGSDKRRLVSLKLGEVRADSRVIENARSRKLRGRGSVPTPVGLVARRAVAGGGERGTHTRSHGSRERANSFPIMTLISRKRFLFGAATLTGGAVTGAVFAGEAKAADLPVYVLDPEWGTGNACCHGCRACHLHASNTLFATAADADLYRAHPGCKCVVSQGPVLPHDTWLALFGLPNAVARPLVDRRTQWVADVLAAAAIPQSPITPPPSTPPSTSPSPTIPAKPSETLASTQPTVLRAPSSATSQLQIRAFRVGRMGRELLIDLDLSGPATMQVRLLAGNERQLVKRHFAAAQGVSRYRLKVPNGIRPGRYHVQVSLRSSRGESRTLRSPFVIHAQTK
jgi:hypothetical protein